MISEELASALARFFDAGRGPSHDELSRAVKRAGLQAGDPGQGGPGEPIGKMKRVRATLLHALDNDAAAGQKLAASIVALLRADGAFRSDGQEYAGPEVITSAQEAFAAMGMRLESDGVLRQAVVDDLASPAATEPLKAYVRRAQMGDGDAALVIGTGKDLIEAVARHVLAQKTGAYVQGDNFPTTLYQTYDRLGLRDAHQMSSGLDADSRRALEQAIYLLALAVNRRRNSVGTGHGRPTAPVVKETEARLIALAMALVSEMLLAELE